MYRVLGVIEVREIRKAYIQDLKLNQWQSYEASALLNLQIKLSIIANKNHSI